MKQEQKPSLRSLCSNSQPSPYQTPQFFVQIRSSWLLVCSIGGRVSDWHQVQVKSRFLPRNTSTSTAEARHELHHSSYRHTQGPERAILCVGRRPQEIFIEDLQGGKMRDDDNRRHLPLEIIDDEGLQAFGHVLRTARPPSAHRKSSLSRLRGVDMLYHTSYI